MTATCTNCGTPLNPGARFCRQCGMQISPAPQEQVLTQQLPGSQGSTMGSSQAQPTAPAYLSPEMPAPWQPPVVQSPPSSGKKWFFILGGGFITFLLILVIVVATVVTRINRQMRGRLDPSRAGAPASAEIEDAVLTNSQTLAFPANGRVEIDNQRGSVEIETWDREQAQVRVYKRGGDAAAMNAVTANVAVQGDRLVISTDYSNQNDVDVVYRIMLPRTATLSRVSSVSGEIHVTGITGDVSLGTVSGDIQFSGGGGALSFQTVSGDLSISLDGSSPPKSFTSSSVSGDVNLQIPDGVDGDLTFSSVSGDLNANGSIDINLTEAPGHKSATARIGNGGPAYKIRSVSGDVNISR